jgi:hypothetical protein
MEHYFFIISATGGSKLYTPQPQKLTFLITEEQEVVLLKHH